MSSSEAQAPSKAAAFLKEALKSRRAPHGILLAGPRESGQKQAALAFTKALLCEDRTDGDACGKCVHCLQVEKGSHPDFLALTPEEDSSVIKIEALRALIARSFLRPMTAQAKVFVIEPAEAMNEVSQNALLKTLEEPEGNSYFVLISYAPQELLPTVRSRVQTFHFQPLGGAFALEEDLEPFAERILNYLLPGQAERTVPDLSGLDRQDVLKLLDAAIFFLRGALLIGQGAGEILGNVENKYLKEKAARSYSHEELIERIELLSEFKGKIECNVNLKLALSVLWSSLEPTKPPPRMRGSDPRLHGDDVIQGSDHE